MIYMRKLRSLKMANKKEIIKKVKELTQLIQEENSNTFEYSYKESASRSRIL